MVGFELQENCDLPMAMIFELELDDELWYKIKLVNQIVNKTIFVYIFRPPPRRVQGAENSVRMCTQFAQEGFCRLANQCADAHSAEELQAS